jgi:hypothetical protein
MHKINTISEHSNTEEIKKSPSTLMVLPKKGGRGQGGHTAAGHGLVSSRGRGAGGRGGGRGEVGGSAVDMEVEVVAVVARELVTPPSKLAATRALLRVQPCLGEPKIASPSPRMCLEALLRESSFLAPHTVVTRCHLSHSPLNPDAHLQVTKK